MRRRLDGEDIFAIIAIICILIGVVFILRRSMTPEEGIRYQADVCSSSCNGTANFDACFQACMWRE